MILATIILATINGLVFVPLLILFGVVVFRMIRRPPSPIQPIRPIQIRRPIRDGDWGFGWVELEERPSLDRPQPVMEEPLTLFDWRKEVPAFLGADYWRSED